VRAGPPAVRIGNTTARSAKRRIIYPNGPEVPRSRLSRESPGSDGRVAGAQLAVMFRSFGVGLARNAPFHMYAQPRLGRVVLDVRAPYRTVPVRDYFLNTAPVRDRQGSVHRGGVPPGRRPGRCRKRV
jgi:hypothetical protein